MKINRQNINTLLLLVSIFLSACTSQKNEVSLLWEIKKADDGYHKTFKVVNKGNVELKNNWTIYFSQLPSDFKEQENAAIKIEQISGTYHKILPSEHYESLAENNSASVTISTGAGSEKCSFYPEGAFIIFKDNEGKDMKPISLEIMIDDSDSWGRSNNIGAFERNLQLNKNIELKTEDIFPRVKSFEQIDGVCITNNSFHVTGSESLSSEKKTLIESLISRIGSQISTSADTEIKLELNQEIAYFNDEHYFLDIKDSLISIQGKTPQAIFNGTQSLLALLEQSSTLPYGRISDYPDLQYRGLMLDVARNFTSKEDLLKVIDLLASYKLNVLHLHLTDDEGWRIEIEGIEDLTDIGAKRGYTVDESECLFPAYGSGWNINSPDNKGNGFYSREDFIEILKYAKERHVTIIPEIDFPGHSRAAIRAMTARYKKHINSDKEEAERYLLEDFDDQSVYRSAQSYTDNVINVSLPSAYRFVSKVIDELDQMYQDAEVNLQTLHIGGDEVPVGAWTESPACKQFLKEKGMKSTTDLSNYFIGFMLEYLKAKNIKMGGWQEIALTPDGKTNSLFAKEGVLAYCWHTTPDEGNKIAYKIAGAGYPVIMSNVTNLYMDLSYNDSFNEPGHNWSKSVNEFTSFDMLPFSGLISNETKKNIQGIQGQLWTETVRNHQMLESFLFPKIYGLVERAWNASPQWMKTPNTYTNSVSKYNKAITDREMPRLAELGVNFRIDQPGLKVVGGKLHANSNIGKAEIRYTTDGTDPDINSHLWTSPIESSSKLIKAKAYYLGKESKTTILKID